MPVRHENDTLIFEGPCTIEEAEALHTRLCSLHNVTVDLAQAGHLHTAVVQLLMASTGPVRGVGDDPVLRACFAGRIVDDPSL